ncbi:hypothetical protein [Chloroflexus sp.]|uniref:hypothetical protein n=1 Tax=Chloroflexus sp. TaxID=1904827 RepID=UPI002ACD59AC|nr:hypothetical protein [Chloroflexus sp.]
MGLTCLSFHVYARDTASDSLPHQAVALAVAAAQRLDFEPVARAEDADRTLIAIAEPPWISYFDLANPPVISAETIAWGKQFSAVATGPVLLTSVWDSDGFAFLSFQDGKQVDAYASRRGMIPGRLRKWTPQQRATAWSTWFARTVALAEVEAVTAHGLLMADTLLRRLSQSVGLAYPLLARTAQDLQTTPWPNQQLVYLRSLPGQQTGGRVEQKYSYRHIQTKAIALAAGSETVIAFELHGPIGAFNDPRLELTGPAIATDLVHVVEASVIVAEDAQAILAGKTHRFTPTIEQREIDGQRWIWITAHTVSAQQCGIPAGKRYVAIYLLKLQGSVAGSGTFKASCAPDPRASYTIPLQPEFIVHVQE